MEKLRKLEADAKLNDVDISGYYSWGVEGYGGFSLDMRDNITGFTYSIDATKKYNRATLHAIGHRMEELLYNIIPNDRNLLASYYKQTLLETYHTVVNAVDYVADSVVEAANYVADRVVEAANYVVDRAVLNDNNLLNDR
jgi:hypothetical protein